MTEATLPFATAHEIAGAIRSGAASAREVTRLFLDRIERGRGLRAFTHVDPERALAQADAADRMAARGEWLSPWHGVPVAIKDAFAWDGTPLTGGSRAYAGRVSDRSSAVVERLCAAGMVVLGKTAMTELAFGLSGQNPTLGTARNPWDARLLRAPGGSSAGAGVAVAAGLAPIAVGGDTGGSVRAPGLHNHLVGYKPSSGMISRTGALPLAETLDVVGPIARSVADARGLAALLAGVDPEDPATLERPRICPRQPSRPRHLAVLADDALPAPLQPAAREEWHRSLTVVERAGWTIEPWTGPAYFTFAQLGRDNSTVIAYEAFRRFGQLALDESAPLWQVIRTRILAGADVTDVQYRVALERRGVVMACFAHEMRRFDGLLVPGSDQAAQPLDPDDARHAGLGAYLRPANFLGAAAVALPTGRDPAGMPLGLQLLAPAGDDERLLALAEELEVTLDAGRPRPILGASL